MAQKTLDNFPFLACQRNANAHHHNPENADHLHEGTIEQGFEPPVKKPEKVKCSNKKERTFSWMI